MGTLSIKKTIIFNSISSLENINPIQIVVALVYHHHVPPLLHVGPLGSGYHQN